MNSLTGRTYSQLEEELPTCDTKVKSLTRETHVWPQFVLLFYSVLKTFG